MRDAALAAVADASAQFLETLRLANLHQWVTQLKTDTTKFDMVRYKENTEEFLAQVHKRVQELVTKFNDRKMKVKAEFQGAFTSLKRECETFYHNIGHWVRQLLRIYKQPSQVLEETVTELFQQVITASEGRSDLTESTRVYVVGPARERIALLVAALADLTTPDDKHLRKLFADVADYAGNLPQENPLSGNSDFRVFATEVAQLILDAMLPVVDPAEVLSAARDFLTADVEIYDQNEDILQAVSDNFHVSDFRAALPTNDQAETIQKLRNLDLLVYHPKSMSEERFITLIKNTGVIHSVDKRRVLLAQRLKILLTFPDINNGVNPRLLSDLYEAILYCAATAPEDSLDRDYPETFDECMNAAKRDGKSLPWARDHYIGFKLMNLLYIAQDSPHTTTFLSLHSDDKDVASLFSLAASITKLGQRLKQVFQRISGDRNPASLHNTDYITYYSAKTLPAKDFHTIRRNSVIEVENREQIETAGNKIEINFLNDKLRSQTPQRGQDAPLQTQHRWSPPPPSPHQLPTVL